MHNNISPQVPKVVSNIGGPRHVRLLRTHISVGVSPSPPGNGSVSVFIRAYRSLFKFERSSDQYAIGLNDL